MGRVALLTREGEIALAKRIEEGKNQVTNAILSHQPGAGALPRAARHPARAATPRSRMSSTSTRRSSPRRRRSSSPAVVVNASATSIASCASGTSSSSESRKLRGKSTGKTRRKRGQAPRSRPGSASSTRPSSAAEGARQAPRAQHRQPDHRSRGQRADRRGLVQRLRDLLDDIERAERVIQLWTNGAPALGRGSAEPHLRLVPRPGGRPGQRRGQRPAPEGGQASSPAPRPQQIWVAQQEIKPAEERANARADEIKHVMAIIKQGQAQGGPRQEGDGRGQPPARHLDRQEVHQPRACSSST